MDSTKLRDIVLEEADKFDSVDVHDLADIVIGRLSSAECAKALTIAMWGFVRDVIGRPGGTEIRGVGNVNGFALTVVDGQPERLVGKSRRTATQADWKLKLNALVAPQRSGKYKRLGQCTVAEVKTLQASHQTLQATHNEKAAWYGALADAMVAAQVAEVADLPEADLRPILEAA